MPQNINKNEELKAQLTVLIENEEKAIQQKKAVGLDTKGSEKELAKMKEQLKKLEDGGQLPREKAIQEQQIRVEEQKLKAIEIAGNDASYLENDSKMRMLAINTVGSVGHVVSQADLADIRKGATEFFYNNHNFWDGIEHNPISLVDWLEALGDISWVVSARSIPTYIEENILTNLYVHYDGRYGNDSNMYITSHIMRNGKSWLRHKIVEAYANNCVPVGIGAWPKGEHADVRVFSKCLIAEIDDTSLRTSRDLNQDQLKAILRKDANSYILMNPKNEKEVHLKSRAKVLACGNVDAPMDDATWRVIYTNSIQAQEAATLDELRGIVCSVDADSSPIGYQLPEDSLARFREIWKKVRETRETRETREGGSNYSDPITRKLHELELDHPNFLSLHSLVRDACSSIATARGVRTKDLFENQKNGDLKLSISDINRIIADVANHKELRDHIRRTNETKDGKFYRWDLSKIYEFEPDKNAKPTTPIQEVLDARKLWDEIIEAARKLDNPTPPTPPAPRSDDDSAEDELSSIISAQAPAQEPAQTSEPAKAEAQPAPEPVNPWAAALSHVKQPLAEYQPSLAEPVDEPAQEPEAEPAPVLVNEEMEPIDRLIAKNVANPQVLANLKDLKERRKDGPSAADRIEACASFTSSEVSAIYDEIASITQEDSAKFDYIDEPKHSYRDRYTTTPTDNPDDEYQTINPIKEGASRADDNVASMRNFVLEMDDTPREEQKALASKLMKEGIVNRVVDSGNKSLHMRITVANEILTKDEYKAVHNYLNERFFEGRADRKCSNPSRFTRNPNGYRPDTQKRQTAIVNPDARPLDITEQLKVIRSAKMVEEEYRQLRREIASDANFTKPSCSIEEFVAGWKDSDWKERCEAILDGTGDRNDAFGFVAFLKKAGYVWDEINAAIPNLDSSNKRDGWNIRECDFDKLEVD